MIHNCARKVLLAISCLVATTIVHIPNSMASARSEIDLGRTAMRQGLHQEAEQHFRRALKESPGNWEAYYQLGIALRKQNRSEAALDAFRQAEARWSIPETLSWLADTQYQLGHFDECRGSAERWTKMQPSAPVAFDTLGLCAARIGDYESAATAFRQAISLEDVPERHLELASSAYGMGDYVAAKEAVLTALNRLPNNRRVEGQRLLGEIELALGNFAEANRILGNRPMLGLTHIPAVGGWRVADVLRNGPADRAGIRVGDLVTHFNGQPLVQDGQGLAPLIASQPLGATVELTLRREGVPLPAFVFLSLNPNGNTSPVTPYVAGDDAIPENHLRLDGIRVIPSKVKANGSFRVVVDLTTPKPVETMVPITITMSITQQETILTETQWSTKVQAGQRVQVIKEIPRAAGQPGLYSVRVEVIGEPGFATNDASFEIVGSEAVSN